MTFRTSAPTQEALQELQKRNSELEQEISIFKEKERNGTFLSLAKKVKDLTEECEKLKNKKTEEQYDLFISGSRERNSLKEEKKTLEKEIETLKQQNALLKTKLDTSVSKYPEYIVFRKIEPELGGLDENPKPESLTTIINNCAKKGFEVQQINNIINFRNDTEYVVLMVKKPQ